MRGHLPADIHPDLQARVASQGQDCRVVQVVGSKASRSELIEVYQNLRLRQLQQRPEQLPSLGGKDTAASEPRSRAFVEP